MWLTLGTVCHLSELLCEKRSMICEGKIDVSDDFPSNILLDTDFLHFAQNQAVDVEYYRQPKAQKSVDL